MHFLSNLPKKLLSQRLACLEVEAGGGRVRRRKGRKRGGGGGRKKMGKAGRCRGGGQEVREKG